MDRKVNKFELYDPIDYKIGVIKEILVGQLCKETKYKRDVSIFKIEYSSNLFRETFKKTETIQEICDKIYNAVKIRPNAYELAKCKNIEDIINLLKKIKDTWYKQRGDELKLKERLVAAYRVDPSKVIIYKW